jgi:hypothetical protein
MTERTRVGEVPQGARFRLLADSQIDGTDERVPTADVLTAFEVRPNGTLIQIQTEVGTLSLDNEAFVDVLDDAE